ncbi:histidine kinase [Aquimarina sp. MMG016]|uniref:sensor histidine kinase n=1 Tax=Aquimarina sp. MMG016 TaxID=2822690 RepID=UPI001B3A08D6|nr:histidine kinase [Aquimarina sp. MMG016]MBQ4819873.1 histidine kinase [Aquimarina sp. MMG016]
MKQFLTYIFFFLFITLSNAQHPLYYHVTEKDGLPDHEFYDMIMDGKGFMWFAANNGLYRYDGQEFKNYTNPEKRGLSVFSLLEDDQGRIWCNNLGGQIFYVENDSLKTFTDISKYVTGSTKHDFRIYQNHFYTTSDEGLMKINLKTKNIEVLKTTSKDTISSKTQGLKLINNKLWYLEGEYENKKLLTLHDSQLTKIDTPLGIVVEIFDTPSSIFLKLNHGYKTYLSYWDNELKEIIQINDLPSSVMNSRTVHVFQDDNGFFWLSTEKGAVRFMLKDGKMTNVKKYFPDKFVTRVAQDKKGDYWFSTYKNGVYIVPDLDIVKYDIQIQGLEEDNILVLTEGASGNIYFGASNQAVGVYNQNTNDFYSLKSNPSAYNSVIEKIRYEKKYNSVITIGAAINIWNNNNNNELVSANWKDYSLLPDNKLLYSSTNESGVIKNFFENAYFKKELNFRSIKKKDSSFRLLRKKRSYTNHYSKKNKTAYVGYVDDLYMYNKDFKGKPIRYENNTIFTTDIAETNDGIIWVSSFRYGLLGLRNDKIVEQYDINSGLMSNKITVLESDGDDVWLATKKGLQCVKRNRGKHAIPEIITIDKHDGLSTYEIFDIEISGNKLFLATRKGLISLDKTKNYQNNSVPDIYISNISINEKDTVLSPKYTLSYDHNVQINFNSNSFNNPDITKTYKYRLKGLDKNWRTKSTPTVRYSSIPYGNYCFEVNAINEDGLESEKPATMGFVVKPPYWDTWWFYMLIISGFVAIVTSLFMLRIKRIRQQNRLIKQNREVELELISSKLVALRSQMNPHFLFNALNSIQEYILTNQKDLASDYLGKFADLMRIYLDHSRKNQITIEEEIRALTLYLDLEKNRFEDSLEYDITIKDEEIFPQHYKIPSLLIQPYVENAIKHGLLHKKTNRRLYISFSCCIAQENIIICEIEDNGIGRERSQEINRKRLRKHNSFASDAGKNRLELLNQGQESQIGVEIIDLKENDTPNGTKVILRIPFTKN